MTRTTKILNIAYGLIVVLFLLDSLPSFDIKNQEIKAFVYFGLLIGTPLILIWNLLVIKTNSKKIIGTAFPTIILISILIVGPMKILLSTSVWRTQTVLYQNGHVGFKAVEFQMKDMGARGYNSRTVGVLYLTPLFMIVQEIPNDIDKSVEWIKVDKEVNELGFKLR